MSDRPGTPQGWTLPPLPASPAPSATGQRQGRDDAGAVLVDAPCGVTPPCENEWTGRCANSPGPGPNLCGGQDMPKVHRVPGSLYCPTDDLCERDALDDWCDTMRAVALDHLGMSAVFVEPPPDPLARSVKEPCWMEVGSPHSKGYRQMMIGGKMRRLNRVALAARRVMVDGLTADHLCRNRGCVNPWHLEAVTVGENTKRGALGVHKSHCKHGHEFTPENTYEVLERGAPKRHCRACRTIASRERKRRAK